MFVEGVAILFLALASSPSWTSAQDFRLPTHIRPVEYYVTVVPWLDDRDFTFDGAVSIWFEVEEPSSNITLHSKFLTIDESAVKLFAPGFVEVEIMAHAYDTEKDFYIILLGEVLIPSPTIGNGSYLLEIPYQGVMNAAPPAAGIWYAEDLPGTYTIATHMQPTYTRMVFPCFDEPSFKARFTVDVGRRNTSRALSNMPWAASYPLVGVDGYTMDSFGITPVMSSYLVAFSVGDLYRVSVEDGLQSLVVRLEYTESYMFPLRRLPQIMDELEAAFDFPFPLQKLDHVALPLFGGGMENFGMIIYGERFILPEDDSDISFPTALLTHETAHMWTGDIVTCAWWDVTWLNEGLTHFFTHWIGSKIEPSTELFITLGTTLAEAAMAAEEKTDSRPMVAEILSPDEIELSFDHDLIYNRGGFIGRMMYYLLGESVFLQGMHNHVSDNAFGNVDESDLWAAMQKSMVANGLDEAMPPIAEVMQGWTRQAGFPLVSVTRNYEDGTASVEQKRFINTLENDHDDASLWTIPLTWTSRDAPDFDDTAPKQFLSEASGQIEVANASPEDWLLVNVQRAGYYRVNYDQRNWELLLEQLVVDPEAMSVVNRAQLTADVMTLCGVQLVDPQICAQWPIYLSHKESHPIVWETAAQNFAHLRSIFGDNDETYKRTVEPVVRFAEARLKSMEKKQDSKFNQRTLQVLRSFGEHLLSKGSSSDYEPDYYQKWKNYLDTKH